MLLHLLADTGNKFKKFRTREDFEAVENVKVRIRVPQGRSVKSVTLFRGQRTFELTQRHAAWIAASRSPASDPRMWPSSVSTSRVDLS